MLLGIVLVSVHFFLFLFRGSLIRSNKPLCFFPRLSQSTIEAVHLTLQSVIPYSHRSEWETLRKQNKLAIHLRNSLVLTL